MQIRSLTLLTRQLAAQHTFYSQTLGLPVEASGVQDFTVQVGTSRLHFRQDDDADGFSHIAVDVPRGLVAEAAEWLRARVPLLADAQGKTVFGPNATWNTTNLYFDDPAGNILEFIARHDLPHDQTGPFGPPRLLHISELGVVVPDVPQAVSDLGQRFGLHAFNGQSDTFTAVGGHGGMLIVVQEGRGWFPVGRRAVVFPFELTFDGTELNQALRQTDLRQSDLRASSPALPTPPDRPA